MSLGISITPFRAPAGALFKGRKLKAVKFTGDGAKPSAGYVVTAAQVGMRIIEGCLVGPDDQNILTWHASVNTTASTATSTNNMTLQAFSTTGAAGSVSASHTIVSGAVVTALVYGF